MPRRIFLLFVLALLQTVWLQAQSPISTPDNAQASDSELTTITGCLQTARGQFTVKDEDGTLHEVAGSGSKLRHLVGKQVEVGGKLETRTDDATLAGGASSVAYRQVLQVKTVKQVADTCK